MCRSLAAVVLALALAGCLEAHPSVHHGDADSVEITQGGDIANAWPLAKRHCAQFERVPQLIDSDGDTARFACVRP